MSNEDTRPKKNRGPLAGIRVVELGTLIAAPFAARLFAEFGADVIKVEAPNAGDPLRRWRKLHNGTSLWWYVQSRNKKSITVDLKRGEGQDIVRRLAANADVLIENFRPGVLEKWNLGWEQLSALNPNLVMVRISGFGQTGPYRHRPGFGAIGEAMGGLRYTTGDPESPPSRVGISIGDSLASLHAVIGALMSLLAIKNGQARGQVVDVSLLESVFNIMESLVPEYDLLGEVRERTGGRLPGIAPSNTYASRDKQWIVIAGNGDSIFRRLMTVIGRPDLADDPQLATNDDRVAHESLIDDAIAAWTVKLNAEDILSALDGAEVPCSSIYSVADIVRDPHFRARDMLLDAQLPDGSKVAMPGLAPKLSATPGEVAWVGPKLGEHTEEVLASAGYDRAEIAGLKQNGIV
ncbi:CoA transferase [Microbacteriaceae bacterium K1510]|nr:CoA transferase [Microbacteriaceae bacterium K1510]